MAGRRIPTRISIEQKLLVIIENFNAFADPKTAMITGAVYLKAVKDLTDLYDLQKKRRVLPNTVINYTTSMDDEAEKS